VVAGLEVPVDRVHGDPVGPVQFGGQRGLGEDVADLPAPQQAGQPLCRDPGVHRQVGRARSEDPVDGGVLLPALLHDHADELAGAHARPAQETADAVGVGGQFAVAEAASPVDDRLGVGTFGGTAGHDLVQQVAGDLGVGVVDRVDEGAVGV